MDKKKILIVSENSGFIDLLGGKLSSDDYQIVAAEDDMPALKSTMNAEKPDMLIIDIMMPRMKGVEICINIRRNHDVPVLMLAADKEKGKVKGLDPRVKGGLGSSVDTEELTGWIKDIFSRNNGSRFKRRAQ